MKRYTLTFLAALFLGVALFRVDFVSNPLTRTSVASTTDSLQNAFARNGGDELSFIYIGSSTCKWSNIPKLQTAVRTAMEHLQEYGAKNGYHVSEIGIARDLDVGAGLRHLDDLTTFDEVVAGRGWMNTGLLRYVYGRFPGIAATPQVVVMLRRVSLEPERSIVDERLVLRKVGITEIENWTAAGAPLPMTIDSSLVPVASRYAEPRFKFGLPSGVRHGPPMDPTPPAKNERCG